MKALKFAREVKAETAKVVWPEGKTTRMMTLLVFVLAVLVGLYLWIVDIMLRAGVQTILGS